MNLSATSSWLDSGRELMARVLHLCVSCVHLKEPWWCVFITWNCCTTSPVVNDHSPRPSTSAIGLWRDTLGLCRHQHFSLGLAFIEGICLNLYCGSNTIVSKDPLWFLSASIGHVTEFRTLLFPSVLVCLRLLSLSNKNTSDWEI